MPKEQSLGGQAFLYKVYNGIQTEALPKLFGLYAVVGLANSLKSGGSNGLRKRDGNANWRNEPRKADLNYFNNYETFENNLTFNHL